MTAVSDNFGGTLSGWTAVNGAWSIVSGKMRGTTVGNSPASYNRFDTSTGSVDCFAQATISSTQAAGFSNTGIACRMRAAANTSYQVTGRHAADTLACWRIVAGAESQQTWQTGSTTLALVWGPGDVLREEVVGSVIRAKLNGAVVGFCVDTTITDGMLVGANVYNDQVGDFGEYDDWSGGALIADGGLLAGFVSGIGAQTARSVAASITPTIPASVAAGQLVIAQGTIRSTTETLTPPAGEGWTQIQLASANSLGTYVWAKVWGLGGQTDDTTPTFTRTGTTGAFVTCSLLTNPLHATRPWTSVASAIVASGQQSNAAAAAATAPSVSGSWTHATVVRLFSSADDNALGTPSAGTALVYGAAAYDATDIAQAMTVAEDITVTTSTGTATVQETVLGNDANNGVTLVVTIPSGTAVTGAATVTGTGSIAGAGVPGIVGAAVVSGAGSVAAAGRRGVAGLAVAIGVGTIAAAGVRSTTGAAAVTGTGSVAGAGVAGSVGAASVSGSGAVSAVGARGAVGAAAVAGTGQVAAAGVRGRAGAATVGGVGAVSAAGVPGVMGAGTVSGVGAISASGVAVASGSGVAQVTGVGTIGAAGRRGAVGQTTLGGVGAIAAAGARAVRGSATVGGTGSIAGHGVGISTDIPSQGSYDSGSGPLVYDGTSSRVYDPAAGRLIYDP